MLRQTVWSVDEQMEKEQIMSKRSSSQEMDLGLVANVSLVLLPVPT